MNFRQMACKYSSGSVTTKTKQNENEWRTY